MKLFWVLVAIVLVAAVAAVLRPGQEQPRSGIAPGTREPAPVAMPPAAAHPAAPPGPAAQPGTAPSDERRARLEDMLASMQRTAGIVDDAPVPALPRPDGAVLVVGDGDDVEPGPADGSNGSDRETAPAPSTVADLDEDPMDLDAALGLEPEPRDVQATEDAAPVAVADGDAGPEEAGLTINGKPIFGAGTEADPYVLPWGVLLSAARSYQPRQGKTDLPGWTQQLDGEYVRLTGFAFLPLLASETDEVLLMLNQWDGCCIGVPPTPYDSVEVSLRASTDLRGGHGRSNYVTITGRMTVDPYLVRGWLISLYVLDDAKIDGST